MERERGPAGRDNERRGGANGIAAARQALGLQLAALRRAAGYSQKNFAPLTGYQRSTVANVETGRQNVPRAFWERCARALGADVLVAGYDQIEAMVTADRQEAARAAHAVQFVALPAHRQPDEIHIWLSSSGSGITHHLIIPRSGANVSQLAAILRGLLEPDATDDGDHKR